MFDVKSFSDFGVKRGVLGNDELTPTARLVAAILFLHANREHYEESGELCSWPAQQTIADMLGVSIRSVRRAVQQLIESGHIELVHSGKGTNVTNRYRLTASAKHDMEGNGGSAKRDKSIGQTRHRGKVTSGLINSEYKTQSKRTGATPPAVDGATAAPRIKLSEVEFERLRDQLCPEDLASLTVAELDALVPDDQRAPRSVLMERLGRALASDLIAALVDAVDPALPAATARHRVTGHLKIAAAASEPVAHLRAAVADELRQQELVP